MSCALWNASVRLLGPHVYCVWASVRLCWAQRSTVLKHWMWGLQQCMKNIVSHPWPMLTLNWDVLPLRQLSALQRVREAATGCRFLLQIGGWCIAGSEHQNTLRCGFPELMVLDLLSAVLELKSLEAFEYAELLVIILLSSNVEGYAKNRRI